MAPVSPLNSIVSVTFPLPIFVQIQICSLRTISDDCVKIYLNDYCKYSYNKWHNVHDPCPLCLVIPSSKFHLTLECGFSCSMWNDLEPILIQFFNSPVTNHEKVFGLIGNTPAVILRNFLTFILRYCIVLQEVMAFHNNKGMSNLQEAKSRFNDMVKTEVMTKFRIYSHLGRNKYFEKNFVINELLIALENIWWQILTLYQV